MINLIPVPGLPLVREGDDLGALIVRALREVDPPREGDVLVVAQKIISKSEGRIVRLESVRPSKQAERLAAESQKDARLVELILRESRDVIRVRPGLIVVEDRRGFICANAGIDRSNIEQRDNGEEVALLPLDSDDSARRLRNRIRDLTRCSVGVVVNDSHGRAFREGTVGVAIGVAGLPALQDHRGESDLTGYVLQHTVIGLADEIAAAASLLMGPAAEGIPVVLIRGLNLPSGDGSATDLQRPAEKDMFR